jgi:hypothetical protein
MLPRRRVGLDPCLIAQGEVHGDRVRAVHQPDPSGELKETHKALAGFPGEQSHRNLGSVDQGQADEDNHHRDVAGPTEDVRSQNADEKEGNRHPAIWLCAGADVAAMRHGKPVNAVCRKGKAGHIERWCDSENIEPGESNQKIRAGDELHEPGHPEPPHPHGSVHLRAGGGKTEQRLAAPNEITGAQAEESDCNGKKL